MMSDCQHPPSRRFHIGLYRATRKGARAEQQRVVLYLGNDCDWSEMQRSRNGTPSYNLLATAEETEEARIYRESSTRAMSLKYSGRPPQDLFGLEEDLRALGYSGDTLARLLSKARPSSRKICQLRRLSFGPMR